MSVDRKCKKCGSIFKIYSYILKRKGRGQYCSFNCKVPRNKINIVKDIVYIEINTGIFAMCDLKYLDIVKNKRWSISYGYILNNGKFMHHILFGTPDNGLVADHINRNKLDNRETNIRFVTQTINNRNRNILSNNTSGFSGIRFEKDRSLYRVCIGLNGKSKYIGRYKTIEDALIARKSAETTYWT